MIRNKFNKKNLIISVSGGETSWYMAIRMKKELSKRYNFKYIFANTGKEREETLEFNKLCALHFNIDLIWVEAIIHHNKRKSCTHKIVNYDIASRNGEPFIEMMKKYGIPNITSPHCTRELKKNPIKSYIKSIYGNDYEIAIGIRQDEFDRISIDRKKEKLIYPLITYFPTTKITINDFWQKQPFRLNLKSYEGNCDYCFKKSIRKLQTLILEDNQLGRINWWEKMEKRFEHHRQDKKKIHRFFRGNLTVQELIEQSKILKRKAIDERYAQNKEIDNLDVTGRCSESCEPF